MELVSQISRRQNADGGWPYRAGTSWTEPTVYALLAQLATEPDSAGVERGMGWLRRHQRSDGGWAPEPAVAQSTWVTSLVALLPPERIGLAEHRAAVDWLLRQRGEESSWSYRLRRRLSGSPLPGERMPSGWPWFPGTAAWVTPTALALVALARESSGRPDTNVGRRVAEGQAFLLARRCADGGWNHGANRALGQDGQSYPETTGIALLALRGTESSRLERSFSLARRYLAGSCSAEGVSWLLLALQAHARVLQSRPQPPVCRDLREASLWALAQKALRGANPFGG